MKETKRPVNIHKTVCDASGELFGLQVGRFHEKLVGPHTKWSCQIIFGAKDFDRYIAWLDKNRQGLTVFVHGVTGDDFKDHTDFAYWLGKEFRLSLEMF